MYIARTGAFHWPGRIRVLARPACSILSLGDPEHGALAGVLFASRAVRRSWASGRWVRAIFCGVSGGRRSERTLSILGDNVYRSEDGRARELSVLTLNRRLAVIHGLYEHFDADRSSRMGTYSGSERAGRTRLAPTARPRGLLVHLAEHRRGPALAGTASPATRTDG